jgi:hypothetical protein
MFDVHFLVDLLKAALAYRVLDISGGKAAPVA